MPVRPSGKGRLEARYRVGRCIRQRDVKWTVSSVQRRARWTGAEFVRERRYDDIVIALGALGQRGRAHV